MLRMLLLLQGQCQGKARGTRCCQQHVLSTKTTRCSAQQAVRGLGLRSRLLCCGHRHSMCLLLLLLRTTAGKRRVAAADSRCGGKCSQQGAPVCELLSLLLPGPRPRPCLACRCTTSLHTLLLCVADRGHRQAGQLAKRMRHLHLM